MYRIFIMMLCIWDGKDGYTLMSSLPNIMAKISNSLIFKIVLVACCLFLTVLVMLQVQDGEVHYIYNNF